MHVGCNCHETVIESKINTKTNHVILYLMHVTDKEAIIPNLI